MLLKLLQVEQSKMINKKLSQSKAMVFNSKNNQKHVQDEIACRCYIHVFTSPEIELLKKFKKHVLDQPEFID